MMDRENMRRALVALRVACDDADAITRDMLRPASKRELGPALHRKNYADARNGIVSGLDFLAMMVADDGEHGDPSGNGGSPTH